ncbi:MAG: sigma-70 factor domain-containing protein, partial [Candidatus Paceibacterota bacterium]
MKEIIPEGQIEEQSEVSEVDELNFSEEFSGNEHKMPEKQYHDALARQIFDDDIGSYLRSIGDINILKKEEEIELAKK